MEIHVANIPDSPSLDTKSAGRWNFWQLTTSHSGSAAQADRRQDAANALHRQVRAYCVSGRGSIAIMGAASLMMLVACAAFAVDEGMFYLERRSAQGAVDLAAIAGAADLDDARDAVLLSLAANGLKSVDGLVVTRGRYEPDAAVQPDKRFVAHLEPANAVHVDLRFTGRLYFAQALGIAAPEIVVSAVAAKTSAATFSIGSRLVRVEDGILNAVLSEFAGSSIYLAAADYEALADANVRLFDFMSALASEADVTAGTYNDVLNGTLSFGDFASAMATAAASSDQPHAATAAISALSSDVATASVQVPLGRTIDLGRLGHLSVGQSSPGLGSSVGVMNLVTAALMAANEQNQVAVNLGSTIPGLPSVTMKLAIGEPPQRSGWINVGEKGKIVRTSQARLQLNAKIEGSGDLLGSVLDLPLVVEAAYGEAELTRVHCAAVPDDDHEVVVDARSGPVKAWIGVATESSFGDWSQPAVIEDAIILTLPLVRGSSYLDIGGSKYEKLTFTGSEIGSPTPKTTTSGTLGDSIVDSLVNGIKLETLLGLSVTDPLKGTIEAILSDAAEPLDGVILAVFEALGMKLGEADVWVHGVRCDGAVLVQ